MDCRMQEPDMPGDKVIIDSIQLKKAKEILPFILEKAEEHNGSKIIVSVYGPSGVGKSEIALVLAHLLSNEGLPTYAVSGDNYPRRIPKYNDAERLCVFRNAGVKAIEGIDCYEELHQLQVDGDDSDPCQCHQFPWLEQYQQAGIVALSEYLGSPAEIDFNLVSSILSDFKNGKPEVFLKHMGRSECDLWYDRLDCAGLKILIIEWTHGNSPFLLGVDYPVFLYSSPDETLAHRLERARDGKPDSAFTSMVLKIEQEKLMSRISSAALIMDKNGRIRKAEEFKEDASF